MPIVFDPRQNVRVQSPTVKGAVYELRPLTSRHLMHLHEVSSAMDGMSDMARSIRIGEEKLRLALAGWNVTDADGNPEPIPTEDANVLGESCKIVTVEFIRAIPFKDTVALQRALTAMETTPEDVAQGF